MIMYLKALPKVWSSASNSNDAAVSLAPGSYMGELAKSIGKEAEIFPYYSYSLIIKVYKCFIRFYCVFFSAFRSSVGHGLILGSEY